MEFNMELKEAKEYLNSKGYELIDEGLWQKFKDKVNETGTKFDIMVRKEILGSSSPDAEEGKEGAIFCDKRRQFLLDFCDVAKEYGYKNFGEKVSKACNNKELATVLAKLCVQYFKGTPVKKLVNEKLLLDIYDFKTNWEQLKHDLSLLNLATSIN